MRHYPNITDSEDSRETEILGIVGKICSILGYSDDIDILYRVSQDGSDTKKWNFFDGVHSEMGTNSSDKRGYAIDFKSGKRIVISLKGDLKMKGYSRVALIDIIAANPEVGELIMRLKETESNYRKLKGLQLSVADGIHRKLINPTKD